MGQDGAAHEDGNLLNNLDTSVPSLPRLLAATYSLQERHERRDSQSGGHHRKGSRCGVTHVLVNIVNVRSHGGDHGGQACSL